MIPANLSTIDPEVFEEKVKPLFNNFNSWVFQEKGPGKIYCLRRGAIQHQRLLVFLDEGLFEHEDVSTTEGSGSS